MTPENLSMARKSMVRSVVAVFMLFVLQALTLQALGQADSTDGAGVTTGEGATGKIVRIDEVSIKQILKPKGRPLLVNFWATWCIPCREEFPDLVEIYEKYKGKIDFIVISLDDPAEINRDVPKFLGEMRATMPAYLLYTTDENTVIASISEDWEGGLPFTILYDNGGGVAHTKQGKIKPDIVTAKIDGLVNCAEPKPAGVHDGSMKIANDHK